MGAAFNPIARSVVLARAGHLPLYFYGADEREAHRITPRGLGLGLNNAGLFVEELEERSIGYALGDILLFVTDGVTEAHNEAGEEFGEETLLQLLREHAHDNALEIRDRILDAVRRFAGETAQQDDQTVVVIKAV